MPTTVPQNARRAFGFSGSPYSQLFSDPPPKANPIYAAFQGHGPLDPYFDAQEVDAMADMAEGNYSSPASVTGLQRLVQQGRMQPSQATAIASLSRSRDKNNLAAQNALVDFMSLTGDQAEFQNTVKKWQNTGVFGDPRVVSAMGKAQSQLTKANKVAPTLQKSLTDYNRDIGDEEKMAVYKKQTNKDIPKYENSLFGGNNQALVSKEWGRADKMIRDPRKKKLLAELETMEQLHGGLPENLSQLRDHIRGPVNAPQVAPDASQPVSGAQPAQAAQDAPQSPQIVIVTTQEDYDALPPGTPYKDSNGRLARKR